MDMDNKNEISPVIFLIEDETDINLLARTTLKVNGFNVQWAFSGKEGIEALKDNRVDLIILDVSMPEMNGYEVLKHLKSDDQTSSIPIVFFSALVQKQEIEKGIELGAMGYIEKPFDPDEFPKLIRGFVEKSAQESSRDPVKTIDDPLRKQLRADYVVSMKKKLVGFNDFLSKSEVDNIEMLGHKIAGSGAGYGFPRISEIGAGIEKAAQKNDMETVSFLLVDLAKEIKNMT